jgi:hypothetical protein
MNMTDSDELGSPTWGVMFPIVLFAALPIILKLCLYRKPTPSDNLRNIMKNYDVACASIVFQPSKDEYLSKNPNWTMTPFTMHHLEVSSRDETSVSFWNSSLSAMMICIPPNPSDDSVIIRTGLYPTAAIYSGQIADIVMGETPVMFVSGTKKSYFHCHPCDAFQGVIQFYKKPPTSN